VLPETAKDSSHFVVEAKRESMKRSVNAEICRQWRAQEGIEWVEDVGGSILDGWEVKHPTKLSKEANEVLELQVLRDFGMVEGRDYYN